MTDFPTSLKNRLHLQPVGKGYKVVDLYPSNSFKNDLIFAASLHWVGISKELLETRGLKSEDLRMSKDAQTGERLDFRPSKHSAREVDLICRRKAVEAFIKENLPKYDQKGDAINYPSSKLQNIFNSGLIW